MVRIVRLWFCRNLALDAKGHSRFWSKQQNVGGLSCWPGVDPKMAFFFVISRGKGICILRAIPGHFLNHVQATAYYMNNETISFPGHHTDMHNTTSLNQSQTPRGNSTERQGGAEASTARTRMHLSAASFTCENGNKNSRAFWSASGQKAYLDGHEHAQKQTYLPSIAGSGRNHSSQHLHYHCIPVSPGKVLLLRLPVPRLCGRGKILRGCTEVLSQTGK